MKLYEGIESSRKFMSLLPVYARIDGRSFSAFTKGMNRPYDLKMTECMQATTKALVEQTGAIIGYTQSDEISLAWYSDDIKSQMFFDGKIQKMCSVLAALATAIFTSKIAKEMPQYLGRMPHFDCRVFQLPNKVELANTFLWRERDATKNAISTAARSFYSHKELHGKKGSDMQEMIFQKGMNFNDYPDFFKRGTFYQRRDTILVTDDGWITRGKVQKIEMPPFNKVSNRVGVIFDREEPTLIVE